MKNESDIVKVKVEIPVLKRHRRYIAKAFGSDHEIASIQEVREYVVFSFSQNMALWYKYEQKQKLLEKKMDNTEQK